MKTLRSVFRRSAKFKSSSHPGRSTSSDSHSSDETSTSGRSNNSSNRSSTRGSARSVASTTSQLLQYQKQQLIDAFRIIDTNGDGKISLDELKAAWDNMGEKITYQEVWAMIREADSNGDGKIDLQEFITLNDKLGLRLEGYGDYREELQRAFIVADVNRDGRLSADEVQRVMIHLGLKKMTLQESLEMLRYVDSDQDDLISYQEFEQLMISI